MPFSELKLGDMTIPLHWYEWGSGDQPPLLLLHGFMGHGATWEPIARALSNTYYVVAPDLPFHGQSLFPEDDVTPEITFETVARGLQQWIVEQFTTPLAVVGYSMGGRLALYLAAHESDLFSRLVLESASPGILTEKERRKRRESDKELAEQLFTSDFEAFLHSWYQAPMWGHIQAHPKYPELLRMRQENNPHQLALALRVLGTGNQPPVWKHLPEIRQPVLLLAGEYDARYIHIMDTMRRQLPFAEFQAVADCGHNIHFERPELFIKLVRNFLKGK